MKQVKTRTINTIFAFLLLLTLQYSFGQNLSPSETKYAANKADQLDISATKSMIAFIAKREIGLQQQAISQWNEALALYNKVLTKGTVDSRSSGTAGSLQAFVYDSRKSMIQTYLSGYGDFFANELLNEKEEERTKKVNLDGNEYKISKTYKKHFDSLTSRLKKRK